MNQYDDPNLEDPLWPYILETRLREYVPYIRKWWQEINDLTPLDTGSYDIDGAPHGLQYRFSRSPLQSPILGVQAFPFIRTTYLQMSGIRGGMLNMVERVCRKGFMLDEFVVVAKANLPSICQQSQFIIFIPENIYNNRSLMGHWVYLTQAELAELGAGRVSESLRQKAIVNA